MKEHISFNRLSEYIDGFLDNSEKGTVEKHLSLCELCRRECAALQKIQKNLSLLKLCVIKNSDEFVRTTMKRIEQRRFSRTLRKYIMPASAAAAILVVIGFGFLNVTPSGNNPPSVAENNDASMKDVDYVDNVSSDTRIRDIVATIKNHKGKVISVTDGYVEAEAQLVDYQGIRRDFDFVELPATLVPGNLSLAGASQGGTSYLNAPKISKTVTFRIRRK